MAETKIVIYASRNALEEIAVFNDVYPNLHHIFKTHATLCVDMTDEELDNALEDLEGDLSQFCLKNDIGLIALHPYFETLNENYSQVVEKPRSMFLLDISTEKAKELSENLGVIVQSDANINDNVLQFAFRKGVEKGEIIEGTGNGWQNLFKGLTFPPSNSIVISDNYLLQNEKDGKLIGFENLKLLLHAILPLKLGTVFHLFIITPMPQKISSERANQLNGMLKAYLRTIRDYEIQLEFVFSNTIHPRKIISNYFVIVCDKGFQLFHPTRTKEVHDANEIAATSILHDTSNSLGDTLLTISTKDIENIRKECKTLREQINAGIKDPTKKIIGDCGKNKEILNRLLH